MTAKIQIQGSGIYYDDDNDGVGDCVLTISNSI